MSFAKKTALVTGLKGQDGTYLAEYLVTKGYSVIGTSHTDEGIFLLPKLVEKIEIKKIDFGDTLAIKKIIEEVVPDEVYNLAARSSSSQLFDDPIATAEINGVAAVRFLEAIREVSPNIRFCQAASSEMFAGNEDSPQDENTPYRPINAYGAAKAYAANIVNAYRKRHGLFAVNAILFNHESPRRSAEYVTRKITKTVAQIALGQADKLILGNLDSTRDWGFAGDYARAMWLILQQAVPEDYVIATGESHSVRDFCEIAFSHVSLNYRDYVCVNPEWDRRAEQLELRGNSTKIQRLGWQTSIGFADLVRMMVDADLANLKSN